MLKTNSFSRSLEEIPPTILTIFGATGDLSADYLLPALLHMQEHKMLPETFKLVCVGRKNFDNKEYLKFIVSKSAVLKKVPVKVRQHFLKHLLYYKGDFENPESFRDLAKVLADQEKPQHVCYNRLYYFATSPQYFASITKILKDTGLLINCAEHKRETRVLVEKPFGFNFKSAQALNALLLKYFKEEQIYRIDHYQGKETVQNLMVARFANGIFEPLWNKDYIDHVEISVLEVDDARNRASFYDEAGALRDMVQNHLLQILALMAMNEPKELTAEYIRTEKLAVLAALRLFDENQAKESLVRGQYVGYKKQVENFETQTETFVALKTFIDLPRWQNVPFYLRTGKALGKKRATEISVHFKEPARCLFQGCTHNVLTFTVLPEDKVSLHINTKIPGFGVALKQTSLEFGYKKEFKGKTPSAYERLLLDFMQGDQRLFIRSDEIEVAWKYIDSIYQFLHNAPLYTYKPKTAGPEQSEEFIKKDLREWWTK